MAVRIERIGPVWTVIDDRPEARNAMDPESADALTAAFLESTPTRMLRSPSSMARAGRFARGGISSSSARSTLIIRSGNSISLLHGRVATVVKFHADRWGRPGWSWTSRSLPQSRDLPSPEVWSFALWCDFRVMAEDAYFGVYCRRWGVPLIDGGTVRLPRIVGQGRALEITLTGRKVPAEECLNIGLCEYVTPKGGARGKAEELAREIARFPQVCVRADRRSTIRSHGLGVRDALIQEWYNGREALIADGVSGASRFKDGLGRHGDFAKIL